MRTDAAQKRIYALLVFTRSPRAPAPPSDFATCASPATWSWTLPPRPVESPRLVSRVASQLAGSERRSVALGISAAALGSRGLPHGVKKHVEQLYINPWVEVAAVERAVRVLAHDATCRWELLEHVSRVE